jgi:hypothetical protein
MLSLDSLKQFLVCFAVVDAHERRIQCGADSLRAVDVRAAIPWVGNVHCMVSTNGAPEEPVALFAPCVIGTVLSVTPLEASAIRFFALCVARVLKLAAVGHTREAVSVATKFSPALA